MADRQPIRIGPGRRVALSLDAMRPDSIAQPVSPFAGVELADSFLTAKEAAVLGARLQGVAIDDIASAMGLRSVDVASVAVGIRRKIRCGERVDVRPCHSSGGVYSEQLPSGRRMWSMMALPDAFEEVIAREREKMFRVVSQNVDFVHELVEAAAA